jgi:four helix bundle protein
MNKVSGKIEKLEDINAWKEARKLSKIINKIIRKLPKHEQYGVGKHLLENGRNVPGNIAEGFGRFYYKDSVQFYRVAKGSLNEIKSDVYICFDRKYIDEPLLKEAIHQIEVVDKLVSGLIKSAYKVKKETK